MNCDDSGVVFRLLTISPGGAFQILVIPCFAQEWNNRGIDIFHHNELLLDVPQPFYVTIVEGNK